MSRVLPSYCMANNERHILKELDEYDDSYYT
jgi:hypothetical protein